MGSGENAACILCRTTRPDAWCATGRSHDANISQGIHIVHEHDPADALVLHDSLDTVNVRRNRRKPSVLGYGHS